jgi:hypothetical protein
MDMLKEDLKRGKGAAEKVVVMMGLQSKEQEIN